MWETNSLLGGEKAGGNSFFSRHSRLIIIIVVLWNILLFALAVAAIAKERRFETTNYYNSAPAQLNSINVETAVGQAVQIGHAVSFDDTGALVIGGGTTIYRNVSTVPVPDRSIILFNVVASLSETRIVVGYHLSTGKVVLQTLDLEGQEFRARYASVPTDLTSIEDIVVLQPSSAEVTGLFVAGGNNSIAVFEVVPEGAIAQRAAASFSMLSRLSSLGHTSFAVTRYSRSGLSTVVGVFAGDAISFFDEAVLTQNSHLNAIIPLTTTKYLVAFASGNWSGGILNVQRVLVNYVAKTITLQESAVLPYSHASFTFSGARLSDNSAVISYIDASWNYDTVAVVIQSADNGPVQFGSIKSVQSGFSFNIDYDQNLWSHISVVPLMNQRFAVVYSDWANGGRVTATYGALSDAGSLLGFSTQYVLTPPNPNLATDHYFIRAVELSATRFIVVDSLYGTASGIQITMAESLRSPTGVIVDFDNKHVPITVVGGTAKLGRADPPFTIADEYYTNTFGQLFTAVPEQKGNYMDANPDQYIIVKSQTNQYSDMLIHHRGRVGIALAEDTIALKLRV